MKRIEDMIIFEDREILVCYKPAGFAVQNARIGTMNGMIKNYLASKQPEKILMLPRRTLGSAGGLCLQKHRRCS